MSATTGSVEQTLEEGLQLMSEDNQCIYREFCRTNGKVYAKEFGKKLREFCSQRSGLGLDECNLKLIIRLFSEEFAQYLQEELNINITNVFDNSINSSFNTNNNNNNNINIEPKQTNCIKHELDFSFNSIPIRSSDENLSNSTQNQISVDLPEVAALATDANHQTVPSSQTIVSEPAINGNNSSNTIDANITPVFVNTSNITRITTTNGGSHSVTVRPKSMATPQMVGQQSAASSSASQTATHDDYSDLSDNETETSSPKTHYRKFFRRLSFKGLRKGLSLP